MTSEGSSYARFRRALLTKNIALIDAAAAELEHIGLADALRVLVVMADRNDDRFERAAAKFAARVTLERRLNPAEAHRVLALAQSLPLAPEAVTSLLRPFVETRGGTSAP